MKKKFTFLIAAIAAILMMAQPEKAVGQTRTTMTFDFEDSGAHTTTTNSYGTHTYTENGVNINTTYFDCISNSGIGGSYLARGRVAQKTTNSPELTIGPIDVTGWTITSITYYTKGATAINQVFKTKTDTDSDYVTQITTYATPSKSTQKTATVSITGKTSLYLKWIGSVSSQTNSNRDFDIDVIVITYTTSGGGTTTAAPTISGNNPFLTNTTVTITNAASADGADIFYTLNGDTPTTTTSATCFAYSVPFEVSATTTVKAIAKKSTDTNASSVVSNTFTKVTPITVSAALTAISALPSNGTIENQCVSGVVCTAGSLSSGAITYYISVDGTESNRLQVYKGKGLYNADFEAAGDIAVGDEVVVYGTLKNFNGTTPEFDKDSYLLSKIRKPSPELAWSAASYTANYGGSIEYPTLTNPNSVTVTYSSSETNVATIDPSTGEITLNANGDTEITASFAGDATYQAQEVSYTLTVAGMLESPGISFANTEINMTYDEDYEGQALTNPHSLTVTYESSDTDIADVDENSGVLALYKAGTVTITANFSGNATYAEGSASYTLIVTKAAADLAFDETGPFNVLPEADFIVPTFSNPHGLTVTWSSTDEDIAVADANAAVIGSKLGTAVITVSFAGDDRYNSGEASYTIIVTNVEVVTLDLSKNETTTATTTEMTWVRTSVSMRVDKNTATTNTNNYFPGTQGKTYTSTRFYSNSILTITPATNYAITSVVFTATSSSYASALANSVWTNATATANSTVAPYTVTVTPTDAVTAISAVIGGTCGFTSVTVSLLNIPLDNNSLNSNFTIPENTTVSLANLEIPSSGSNVLTVMGVLNLNTLTNSVPSHIIIKDGGQLKFNAGGAKDGVQATVQKEIAAWTTNPVGNWYFIASPLVDNTDPDDVNNMITPKNGDDYTFDLYRYNDAAANNLAWENYNNATHTSGFKLVNGQGYLYANVATKTLEFTGEIKPYTTAGEANKITIGPGFNLIGNPYTFATYINKPYYKLNAEGNTILASEVKNVAINPCTGVIVNGGVSGYDIFFTETSQEIEAVNPGNIQMTLAQTVATRGESHTETIDNAIVSFNEGTELEKFYFGTQNANIYIPLDNEEYAIVSSNAQGEMPVNFKAHRDGQYTITVNPEEVEMGYLHLIDNIAGKDVDLLANPSYSFNARTDDYESRFRLVFSANMTNAEMGEDFAFISDGQLVIANVGEAILQVIDVTGRVVANENINGTCSKAISAKAGVYVLRLINGTDVKTQKIVIR